MDNFRLQDSVARVSGTNLKSVVRVLRALPMVAHAQGNQELAFQLTQVLRDSAYVDGEPAPLHIKPTGPEVDASTENVKKVGELFGFTAIEEVRSLTECPYFDHAMSKEGQES